MLNYISKDFGLKKFGPYQANEKSLSEFGLNNLCFTCSHIYNF